MLDTILYNVTYILNTALIITWLIYAIWLMFTDRFTKEQRVIRFWMVVILIQAIINETLLREILSKM